MRFTLVHFLAVLCKTKTSNDQIHGITENIKFSFLYVDLDFVPTNSALGQFGHIGQLNEAVYRNVNTLFSDVFLGVTVVVA